MRIKNPKGLSIIEVLVAAGIMAILMAGFSSMMLNQNKETRAVAEILSAQDLMKSMIGSLAKGDVCYYILSTKTFNANQVVAGNPQIIDIGTQPIYSSMAASGTPGPVLIKKGDKASAYTSSLEVESIQFEITSGTVTGVQGNFQGRWIVNFDGTKSVRRLKPLSVTAVITANTTVPTAAGTISCLGSGGSMGSGDENFLTKWATDSEIKQSVVFEDPINQRIGIGTTTPANQLQVSGSVGVTQVLTSGKLQIVDVVVENAACTSNGLVARDATGLLLSCQTALWKKAQSSINKQLAKDTIATFRNSKAGDFNIDNAGTVKNSAALNCPLSNVTGYCQKGACPPNSGPGIITGYSCQIYRPTISGLEVINIDQVSCSMSSGCPTATIVEFYGWEY